MLHFILGRAKTGKTYWIKEYIKEITQRGEGKAVLIVPEQSTLQTERDILSFVGNESGAFCEVLSFKRLCHRVFSKEGGVASPYADKGAQNLIMGLVLNDLHDHLTFFDRVSQKAELVESLNNALSTFKNYCITPKLLTDFSQKEEISPALSAKLSDFALIYAGFETVLAKSYQDPRDDLTRLSKALLSSDYLDGKTIFIDGFWSFTPQEAQVICAMFQRDITVHIALCLDKDSFFFPVAKTYNTLSHLARSEGLDIQTTRLTKKEDVYPAELSFLEENLFKKYSQSYEIKTDNITLHSAQNPFSEVEYAAQTIWKLVMEKGYSFSDFLVAARDLTDYAKVIEAVFSRAGIPYFLDMRSDILTKPVLLLVLSALEAVKGNFAAEDILRCVKTGIYTVTKEEGDLLENYVLMWDIRGKKWESEFLFHPRGFLEEYSDADREMLNRINEIRERVISPLLVLKKDTPASGKVFDYARCLYAFITKIGLQQKIADLSQELYEKKELDFAFEYAQLWDILVKVLDQMVTVAGEVSMDFSRFCANFKLILSGYDIGIIPTSLDEVMVGQVKRVRPGKVKCVILLGVNDGIFPKIERDDSLISDDEKGQLEAFDIQWIPSAKKLLFDEEFLFYSIATLPSDDLFISCVKTKMDGQPLSPSRLIGAVKKIFVNLTCTDEDFFVPDDHLYLEKELLAILGKGYKKISSGLPVAPYEGAVMAAVEDFGQNMQTEKMKRAAFFANRPWLADISLRENGGVFYESASRIERFYSCRFSYFMQYMLGAKPRRVMELSTLEIGNFVHSVLEKFFRHLKAKNISIHTLSEKDIKDITTRIIAEVIGSNFAGLSSDSARYRYLFNRISKTIFTIVENMVEEFSVSDFKPVEFELSIGKGEDDGIAAFEVETTEGVRVRITGKVDRVDGYVKDDNLYVRIVDYKTGTKEFVFGDVLNGLNLQMLIYLFAVCRFGNERYKKKVEPAAVLYLHVNEPNIPMPKTATEEEIKQKVIRHFTMNGIVVANDEIVSAMEKDITKQGRFIPVKLGKGGFCGESLVRPDQLKKLYGHVEKMIADMACDLGYGDISITPYMSPKGTVPCTYCEYKEACLFDIRHGQNFFKKIQNISSEEFFEAVLGGEENGNRVDG